MSDHELLALAAKAAGRTLGPEWDCYNVGIWVDGTGKGDGALWSPLTDDGDALRLANSLGLTVRPHLNHMQAFRLGYKSTKASEPYKYNPDKAATVQPERDAAARRAIVRAAALIGSKMP